MPKTMLERIDLLDLTEDPPALICAFFWSDATGLTCSDRETIARLTEEGIATPPEGDRVFPRDGRRFFDALRWTGSSYVQVTRARKVQRPD